jgi:hypothetical protein
MGAGGSAAVGDSAASTSESHAPDHANRSSAAPVPARDASSDRLTNGPLRSRSVTGIRANPLTETATGRSSQGRPPGEGVTAYGADTRCG